MDNRSIKKLEADLWESADLLRAGSKLTSNQYCMPVLGLLFLRYAYSRFKLVEAEILKNRPMRNGRRMPVEAKDFSAKSALFLPREAQYDYLVNLPENIAAADLKNITGQPMNSLGEVVNNAMELVEQQSEQLAGVLPKSYTDFSDELLGELLRIFNNNALDEVGGDVIGRVNHKEKTKQEGSQIAKSVLSGKKDKNYKAQKEKMESLAKTVQYFEEEREELITELKLLRALATNGLITTSIVHDLKSINALLVNRVEPMRMAIENNNKMLIERNLNDLYKNDQFLKSWITVVTNQSKKDKRKRLKKNIYDTIEKIVNVLQPILVQKKVQVELIKDEQNAERRIFESDFESIFYNLIINSIEAFSKSSTKNRKIRIELKTNENLVVNYLDNGDGLDNKFKNPYEIFTLGSTSKYDQFGNVIGTGLGMYIIASTVREYNGDYKLTQIQNGFGLEIRIPL